MNEVLNSLDNMLKMTVLIDRGNYPQQIKDSTRRIFIESLDFVLKQSSPETINLLVYEEFKKSINKKQGSTENNQ